MARTPFEVRLEILKLSKDLLTDEFFQKKEPLQNEYQEKINRLTSIDPLPSLPKFPPFPTTEEVIAKAKELYKFVTDEGKDTADK